MYNELINLIRDWYESDQFIPLHEPRFNELDKKYVIDTIESTFVSSVGEYVDRFEINLSKYTGSKRAIATVNGTTALQIALNLVGVKAGDEVLTQPLTFIATANAISYNNAKPVFIDVCRETLGLCPDSLSMYLEKHAIKKKSITINKETGNRISAIMPMHTFGFPCKMKEIIEIADFWNIPVVEDAAEALGSDYYGKKCGTFGKIGVFSFNGNKTITCGGGGAIVTNDDTLADRAKHLTTTAKCNHDWEFTHDEIGYNFRMPNLNAALACSQLEQLNFFIKDKNLLYDKYKSFFNSVNWAKFVEIPKGCNSNCWLNTIIMEGKLERDMLLKELNKSGIMSRPAWTLMTDLKMYSECSKGDISTAISLQNRIVNLPSSARLNGR